MSDTEEQIQKELNTPLFEPGVKAKNEEFLNEVIKKIKEGKIDLYNPETLINFEIYDQLPPIKQGKADLEALNLLSALREMKDLYDNGFVETYQMEYLVDRIRNTKERLEIEEGDIFII